MTNRRAALAAIAVAIAIDAASGRAHAQSEDELKQARELFQEAYRDEQDKRFDLALEKFQRVAKVRESPSVRYRIGSVLESLGRLRESRDTFRALAAQKSNMTQKDQPIADSAAERAAALDKKIPHLVVRVPDNAPADAKVTLDGAPIPVSKSPRLIELDPGDHVVQATGTGSKPFEKHVMLEGGGDQSVDVAFEPATTEIKQPPPPPGGEDVNPKPNRTLAYVALGAGGVLLVSGIVLLEVRESDISDINKNCPNGNCPISVKDKVTSDHDQAALFGPLGIGCSAVGVVALAAGVYLMIKAPSKGASPTPPPTASVTVDGRATPGGGVLGLRGTF